MISVIIVIFMIYQSMIFNVVDMGLHIFVVNTFVVNKKSMSIQKTWLKNTLKVW